MSEEKRFGGFLTARDELKLDEWGEQADATSNEARQDRYNLRQRAARVLRDLVILERDLPDTFPDRGLIHKTFLKLAHEAGVGRYAMRDLFTFLFQASKENNHSHLDWQHWLQRAIRRVETAAFVDVEIRIYEDHHIDALYEAYEQDRESFIRRSDHADQQALVREGLVPSDEFTDSEPFDIYDTQWRGKVPGSSDDSE